MSLVDARSLRRSHSTKHQVSDYNNSLWAYYVLRPSAFHLTPFFLRLGFSATAVTLLALAILVCGLLLIAFADSLLVMVVGAALVNVFYILDFVDGTIARHNRTVSLLGELLDFLSGILFHAVMPLAVACYLFRSGVEMAAPFLVQYQYEAVTWWYVGMTMSGMFLLRRVVSQKMQITFAPSGDASTRRPPWQVTLRSLEAVKTPLLFIAGMLALVNAWLLFYASYGIITFLGLVGLALYRARKHDSDGRVATALEEQEPVTSG